MRPGGTITKNAVVETHVRDLRVVLNCISQAELVITRRVGAEIGEDSSHDKLGMVVVLDNPL